MEREELSEVLKAISVAIIMLRDNPLVNKLEGKNWSVYMVGSNIRVDIKQ